MDSNILLPYIPEAITVHLGPPDSSAPNVTVSFTDYIKNVASSEIYPTWPESAIRANIIAQISFALNRIYSEHYRSRGYDFDITNSTAYDQSFVNGRDIFENISRIVDSIFNNYVSRQGSVEPLFAAYCDGVRVQCDGLSQWGSVELAEQGYGPYQILTNYYGDDIDIVYDAPVQGAEESYPGRLLRFGSSGNDVGFFQRRLNRISRNYPSIPKIPQVDGIFGTETDSAVRQFQRIFSLKEDGIVGRSTWYAIIRIYNAVKRIADLQSEGIPIEDVTNIRQLELDFGDTGAGVRELQYFLNFISLFNDSIPQIAIDGIFGSATESAIRSFQRFYGLPITGIVRGNDWDKLFSVYTGIIDTLPPGFLPEGVEPYPGYPIRIGSRGDEVRAMQEYLNLISDTYTSIPKLTVDGIFGPAMTNAVRIYQDLFGIEVSGTIGETTWDSILSTYLSLRQGREGAPIQYGGGLGEVQN
ncbi:MAG: spore cortex-lytic protein [Clostridiales bacterium]|nr:spore cortex-lytic protein [Clostridiales bacterium]